MAIFATSNECNEQLARSPTIAFGNATGGVIEGHVNLTARAPGATFGKQITSSQIFSKGSTVPEMEWITAALRARGVAERFAGIMLHDDTLTQTGATIRTVAWLKQHQPDFVPFVNQVGARLWRG